MVDIDFSTYEFLELNRQTTHAYDFIIGVKSCVEPANRFGRTESKEMVYSASQFPNGHPQV